MRRHVLVAVLAVGVAAAFALTGLRRAMAGGMTLKRGMGMRVLAGMVFLVALATGCMGGWLNPSQPGFVIQSFTSYDAITGNNSGTITTNGNSYQFAGDNTGAVYIGGPGAQFRGKNDGDVRVDGEGAFVVGAFGSLATVVNRGKGSLLLGNLGAGQRATITDVGNASLLLGAGTVSNNQSIVVGDDMVSHGSKSVTAGSFWGMGGGFHGSGAGLTDLPTDLSRFSGTAGAALSGRVDAVEASLAGNPANYLASERTVFVRTNGNDAADGLTAAKAKRTLQAGVDAAGEGWTVLVGDGTYAVAQSVEVDRGVTLRSEGGPVRCVVDGGGVTRCVVIDGGTVEGLGIRGGYVYDDEGAGVYLWSGTLRNCDVYSNTVAGSAGYGNGGGVYGFDRPWVIENCRIYGNTANAYGGGVCIASGATAQTVRNCLVYGNTGYLGGGLGVIGYGTGAGALLAFEGLTVARNTAAGGGSGGGGVFLQNYGGATFRAAMCNSIVDLNTAEVWPNIGVFGDSELATTFTCSTPLVAGEGNVAADPGFLGVSDFRLSEISPCVNAGVNLSLAAGAVDLDGNPRVSGGRTDIGAYESPAYPSGVAGFGRFAVVNGMKLVFVVGSVTNVLDGDITQP